jgi:hypothetical protein
MGLISTGLLPIGRSERRLQRMPAVDLTSGAM